MKVGYKIIMWYRGTDYKNLCGCQRVKENMCGLFSKERFSKKAKCIKRYLLLVHDKFVFKSFNKLYTLITTNQIKIKLEIHKCIIILMYTNINI